MNTMIFKTNAKCEDCLAKIEEILQGKISREEWNLDLSDSNRPLTVASDKLAADDVVELISKAGFKIEQMEGKQLLTKNKLYQYRTNNTVIRHSDLFFNSINIIHHGFFRINQKALFRKKLYFPRSRERKVGLYS